MKKIALQIIFVSAFILGYGCDNQDSEKSQPIEIEIVQEKEETNDSGLKLNDGNRWAANEETTTGVHNMMELMNSFTDSENLDAYRELTLKLKEEFSMIFKKCTMTGEAHNQLHEFLIPIKNSFKPLSSHDLNECKERFQILKNHLSIYDEYFE